MLARPRPPERLLGQAGHDTLVPVEPAPEVLAWARATFIDEDAALVNEDHGHLRVATLGFLWCAVSNARGGNAVVGQAEMPTIQGGRWAKVRFEQQVVGWFGLVPDFLVTLDVGFADEADDATFCALVEHELYHCGQAKDAFGAPRFSKMTGRPIFSMREHDVEEFVGVVARYGAGAAAGATMALVEAASRTPLICSAEIAGVCGTCGRPL